MLTHLFGAIREAEAAGGSEGERVKFSCKCSFLELYKEFVTDLLNTQHQPPSAGR